MAELILCCPRAGRPAAPALARLRSAALHLESDGGPAPEPAMLEAADVRVAVASPSAEGTWLDDGRDDGTRGGACLGAFVGAHHAWSRPGSAPPDGTYAMARWDRGVVELVSDVCGSRILWYVLTDDLFLASTSQRAIVSLLGSFELDRAAVAWLLTSGSLGLGTSWDARVRRVPPDARVTLDRAAWRLHVTEASVDFAPAGGDRGQEIGRLRDALEATCRDLDVDDERWVLPLSGGCDSRVLLAGLLRAGVRPRCVTWTTRASLRNPLSDASIARVVARRFGVRHEVVFVDDAAGVEIALTRFVAASEGITDEAGAYLGGLAMWRALRDDGVAGIIRGDEPLPDRRAPESAEMAPVRNGGPRAIDYPEDHVVRTLGLAPQAWPERIARRAQEDLRTLQTRLCQVGWVPGCLANLHGPKTRFVEVANPLLSRRFVDAVRATSPRMLGRARVFLALAAEVSRTIPTARFCSTPAVEEVLARPRVLDAVVRELASPAIERVLPGDASRLVLAAMVADAARTPGLAERGGAALHYAATALPIRVAAAVKPGWTALSLSSVRLGFRAFIASRAAALLEEDALALTAGAVSAGQHRDVRPGSPTLTRGTPSAECTVAPSEAHG